MALSTTWPLTSDGAGAVQFTANQWRTIVTELLTEGILGASSFEVSERALGANMTLDIAAGVGVLEGDDAANQGRYLVREDSATASAVTITTADATNPRWDLVGIQLHDPSEGGAPGRESVFAVATGTPAASPSDPAVPDSFLTLARVVVGAGVVTITDSDIIDLREHATLAHADVLPALSVDTAELADGAVTTAKIAAGAVTADKIANATITATELANNAVTSSKILNGTITANDLADDAVTDAKVGAPSTGTLDSGKIRYARMGNMVSVWTTADTATSGVSLPAGFRPAATVRMPMVTSGVGEPEAGTISTAGVITGPTGFLWSFGVTFSTV